MLFEETNQVLTRNSSVLGTRNPITAQPARIEPFADSTGCNFTDLGYLTSSEDRPHCGLSNQMLSCQLRGFVVPSRSSPLQRRPALLASGSVTYKTIAALGSGLILGYVGCVLSLVHVCVFELTFPNSQHSSCRLSNRYFRAHAPPQTCYAWGPESETNSQSPNQSGNVGRTSV